MQREYNPMRYSGSPDVSEDKGVYLDESFSSLREGGSIIEDFEVITPRIADYTSYGEERSSVPVSPISISDSVRSIYTDLDTSGELPTPTKQNGAASTVEDSLENMWSIVDMVCEEIVVLQTKDETKYHAQRHLAAHAKRLRTLSQMHKQSNEKVQQITQLGLLMEMKLYLEMLRDIEELGKKVGWSSDPLLREVQNIIYKESDMFKLVKQTKR